jgi:tetratricopeptide (TPR) repeat protein
VITVQAFEVPESTDVAEMSDSPVIRLLVDRARLADPQFRLVPENARALRDLCAALDGLPLAIELAIPLLRVYSPSDLVRRLAKPLHVLQAGDSDRPVRHQSLIKAIDWSYKLLEEDQKELFCALSVFAKDFDLSAVEHVCCSGQTKPVEQTLQALVEKNLVQRRATEAGLRFELLDSTLEYVEEKATGMPGIGELQSRHAHHYRSLALQGDAGMRGPDQVRWFETLTLARANINAALAHFSDTEQWKAGLEIADALGWYWYRSAQFPYGLGWLDTFLSHCPDTPSRLRARGLNLKGFLTFVLGDWRSAHALYGESLYMARQVSDGTCECLALSDLGLVERWLGNSSRGWAYALKAVEVARSLEDTDLLSRTLIWAYATTGGNYVGEPPFAQIEEAAELARETGNDWIYAHAYNGLGDLCRELGQYDRSRQAYQTALKGFRRLADRYLSAWTLEGLGQVEMRVGNQRPALERTVEALTLFDGLGDELNVALMLARIVVMSREDHEPEALAMIAGTASVLLRHVGSRGLREAPQIAEAFRWITELGVERTAEWLRGQNATRAAAVAAARHLIATGR